MSAFRVMASLLVALVTLALGAPAQAQGSRLDAVVERGRLIVATYSTAPPLAFKDAKGELVGFEIDIVRMIARDLLGDPNKVEWVIIQSEGRFPSVLSGKADFAIAATTIYPERAAKVAFTHPYMDSGNAVLVRKDANVTSLDELNNPKFTITGQNNPQNAERAKRFVPEAKTVWFDSPSELFLAVKSGRATAMQTDTPIADYYALQNKDLIVLTGMVEKLGVSNNAIFMKPGDFT
jgi:polar amino acid transport system substrate-binding protein